ncbi:MAG: radical SAM protein [Candidatus Magasanikbacteria bacterium]
MNIFDFTTQDPILGLKFDSHLIPEVSNCTTHTFHHYSAGESTTQTIEHNLTWAQTGVGTPSFQFLYVMLPTTCNQRCVGCFTGQDKSRLPPQLHGPFYSKKELKEIMEFAVAHGVKAIVYGGGGELFTWPHAFDYIRMIHSYGLKTVIFTNGSLLQPGDVKRLYDLDVSLIISLRDTVEKYHNQAVGRNHFRRSINAIHQAMQCKMHLEGRLAVEIPVTRQNQERILQDFLPVMRQLGIAPMVEEYILISASSTERKCAHSFSEARQFFRRMKRVDEKMGILWQPETGQRMLGEPKCRRPLYSFAIYPSGDIMDCPSHSICYGNFKQTPISEVVYSQRFRQSILDYQYCPCSVFYTETEDQIPMNLPPYLRRES